MGAVNTNLWLLLGHGMTR